MADVETPQAPEPRALPQVMVGVASPLWAYFGAAAAGGLAYWWMTRWARPVNVEAMLDQVATAAEPMIEAVEAVAELPFEAVEAVAEYHSAVAEPEIVAEDFPELAAASDAPAGAAAIGEPELVPEPVVAAAPAESLEPVVEPAPEPAVEAAAEPFVWAEPEVTAGFDAPAEDAAPTAAPKPKARKAAPRKA